MDAVWIADAVNLFSLKKRQRRHRHFVGWFSLLPFVVEPVISLDGSMLRIL